MTTNGLTYDEMIAFNDLKVKANTQQLNYMIDSLKREDKERNQRLREEYEAHRSS